MARLRRYRSLQTAYYHLKPGHIAEIYAGVSHVDGPIIFKAERRREKLIEGRILSPRGQGERRAVLKEFWAGLRPLPESLLLHLPPTVAAEVQGDRSYALQLRVSHVSPRRYAKFLIGAMVLSMYIGHVAGDFTLRNALHDIWLERPYPWEHGPTSTLANIDVALTHLRGIAGNGFYGQVRQHIQRYLGSPEMWDLSALKNEILRTRASLAAMGYKLRPLLGDPHVLLFRILGKEGRIREF